MAFLVHSPEVPAACGIWCVDSATNISSESKRYVRTLKLSSRSGKFGVKSVGRVAVRAQIKDYEANVPSFDRNARLYEQFSALVKEGSKQSKEEEEKQNYYVNLGYAIRKLREEFPELFYKELSFDIYRDDVVFRDPFNTFVGIENYKYIFWALRLHGRMFFRALWIDIISVWQPVENVIMVRWTIHGVPRIPWESRARFDGTSEYKLDKNGKIFEHRVDNIALNSPPKFRIRAVEEMIQSISCPSTPRPTYFEMLASSFTRFVTSPRKFPWHHHKHDAKSS